jgi:hypothetical protein
MNRQIYFVKKGLKVYYLYIMYNMFASRFLIVVLMSATALTQARLIDRFEKWVNDFKVKFDNEHHSFAVFQKWSSNDQFIENFNAQNRTFVLGHNQFSGMNSAEFGSYLWNSKGGFEYEFEKFSAEVANKDYTYVPSDNFRQVAAPASVNWVTAGGVTPVKDQGQCGSCWSFSTTGALEGAYFTKNGKLPSFSEQQLVDCDNRKNGGKDMGCNGGLMDNAFSWVSKNGGLCSEDSYPYVSGVTKTAGTCATTCTNIAGSKVASFVDVDANSDSAMMTALAKQPVSIAIEADQREFQLYSSGVFTAACGTTLDHGVLAVGYGSLNSLDYYRVKNSWGTTWGDNGYILLGRGNDPATGKPYNAGGGQCGILMEASYPLL